MAYLYKENVNVSLICRKSVLPLCYIVEILKILYNQYRIWILKYKVVINNNFYRLNVRTRPQSELHTKNSVLHAEVFLLSCAQYVLPFYAGQI